MKKKNRLNNCSIFCWLIIGILSFQTNSLPSQSNSMGPDPMLEKLEKQLPPNWSIRIENERLIVKRNEPAYRHPTNLINAPAPFIKKELQENRANTKPGGIEVFCMFVFQMEARWPPERLKRARNTNKAIDRGIQRLSKKYKISNLYNRPLKNPADLYRGKSNAEMRRINAYEKEKKDLEKKWVRFPDYVSRDYCLFLLEKKGMQDEYTLVYPEEASQEMYLMENKFREIFEVWE